MGTFEWDPASSRGATMRAHHVIDEQIDGLIALGYPALAGRTETAFRDLARDLARRVEPLVTFGTARGAA